MQTAIETIFIVFVIFINLNWTILFFFAAIKSLQMYILGKRKIILIKQGNGIEIHTRFIRDHVIFLANPIVSISIFPRRYKWKAYVGIQGFQDKKSKRKIFRINWNEVFEIEDYLNSMGFPLKRRGLWY